MSSVFDFKHSSILWPFWGTATHQTSADSRHRHLWIQSRSLHHHLITETRYPWKYPLVPHHCYNKVETGACPLGYSWWQVTPSNQQQLTMASVSRASWGDNGVTQSENIGVCGACCILTAFTPETDRWMMVDPPFRLLETETCTKMHWKSVVFTSPKKSLYLYCVYAVWVCCTVCG